MHFEPALWDGSDPSYAPCRVPARDLFYWVAPKKYAGYAFKRCRLPGRKGDGLDLERAARCRELTREMVRWYEGEAPKVEPGTWLWLIGRYKSDEFSPFHNVKANTRSSYLDCLKRWEAAIGKVRIADTDYTAIMRWHRAMIEKGRSNDYMSRQFRHLRIVANYGVMIEADHAKRVTDILGAMRFKGSAPRSASPSADQVAAIIAAADAAGDTGFALGLSFQWWLTLRAVDVRGQWLTDEGKMRWADGLTWDMLDRDLTTLRKVPSKTEASMPEVLEWDLTPLHDLRARLAAVPLDQRVGPVIRQRNGQPFKRRRWAALFRIHAETAGVPEGIWCMDLRAGAINHAKKAGATQTDMQHQANHANATTTNRYIRERTETVNRVIDMRTKSQRA